MKLDSNMNVSLTVSCDLNSLATSWLQMPEVTQKKIKTNIQVSAEFCEVPLELAC